MPAANRRTIQNIAEKTAVEAGFTSLPICPKIIAAKHDIVVQAKPNTAGGVSGMLIRTGEQFGILYATHIPSEGFQRFSIGHELGHYFLEGHPEAVLKNGVHQSMAGFITRDRYEVEADTFAAALLMPADMFKRELGKLDDGLGAVEVLARIAETSLTATAFRYVEFTRAAIAVMISEGPNVVSCCYSDRMKDFGKAERLPWLAGRPVPTGTLTDAFNGSPSRIAVGDRDETLVDMSDWFGVGGGVRGREEVVGLGSYGRTLTVICCEVASEDDYDPEEEADSDAYLEERWTPRFRRK